MVKSGDKIQAEDFGKFIAVAEMHAGGEVILGARTLEDADNIARELSNDPQVKRAFSATRAN